MQVSYDCTTLHNMSEPIKNILNIPTESQTVEFKRLEGRKVVEKAIQTVVAMANTDGGMVVLGVDDPEKTKKKGVDRIYGIEEDFGIFDSIGREIQRIVPPLPNIWPPQKILVDEVGKTVGLILVQKAVGGFRSINNRVFIRQERSNKLLSPQELVEFAYAKGFKKAGRELVDVGFEPLGTPFYREWREARGIRGGDLKTILTKTGLARKNFKGKLMPTRAAALLFAEYPNDITDTKCAIRIFQYTGTIETIGKVPNLIGVPRTISGPVIQQIKEAHDYVLATLRSGVRIPSGFTTQYLIPERSIKEAITNAVIHRDYYLKRDITVKIFEDRVEVENPGLFPYNITIFNIGITRASGYRNDLLVKHLREFPKPPNLDQNEGVRAMRSEMNAQNLYPPIFFTYPHLQYAVRVILMNERRASEWEKISFYLGEHKYITNQEARKVTGVLQRDKMTRFLKGWVAKGLLVQIIPRPGFVRGTKYRLPTSSETSSEIK